MAKLGVLTKGKTLSLVWIVKVFNTYINLIDGGNIMRTANPTSVKEVPFEDWDNAKKSLDFANFDGTELNEYM